MAKIWELQQKGYLTADPMDTGSQTMGAKLHRSKGKQPRPPSKVPKSRLSV